MQVFANGKRHFHSFKVKVAEHSFCTSVSFTFSSKTLDPLVAKKWQ